MRPIAEINTTRRLSAFKVISKGVEWLVREADIKQSPEKEDVRAFRLNIAGCG